MKLITGCQVCTGPMRLQRVENKSMKQNKRSFMGGLVSGVIVTLLLVCSVYAGVQLYQLIAMKQQMTAAGGEESGSAVANVKTAQKMQVLESIIENYFLEEVDDTELENGIYRGIVNALDDPYAAYYTPEELEELQQSTQGIYYGIGAQVSLDTDTQLPVLIRVFEGSPAEESGLLAGDKVYKVGDTVVQGMDLTSAVNLIKGDEGTTVHLSVVRDGESDYLEFDVVRRKLNNITIEHEMLEGDIGYIQITEFDEVTVEQFAEALKACRGLGMKGLLIDLRSNPGGSMSAVCDIARQILPKGLIVYTEDKYGTRDEYSCNGQNQLDVPLVILIDQYSASASEILAGAVKDYEIGTLVGMTSYGKGIVQQIITLSDGSAVKLTVSDYYTPKGNNIHEVGIEPDVEVKFDSESYQKDGTDNQLNKAIEVLKEKMAE